MVSIFCREPFSSDIDSSTLQSGTVRMSSATVQPDLALSFTLQNERAGVY